VQYRRVSASRRRRSGPSAKTLRRVLQVLLLVAGLALSFWGAKLVGENGELPDFGFGDYTLFPEYPFDDDDPPLEGNATAQLKINASSINADANLEDFQQAVTLIADVQLDSSDPFTKAVMGGAFRGGDAEFFIGETFGSVDVTWGDDSVPLDWSSPSLTEAGDGKVTLRTEGRVAQENLDRPEAVTIRVWPSDCEQCTRTLTAAVEDWDATALSTPHDTLEPVITPEDKGLKVDIGLNEESASAEVILEPRPAPGEVPTLSEVKLPAPLRALINAVALSVWTLVPWWYLRRRTLQDQNIVGALPEGRLHHLRGASGHFIVLGVIAAINLSAFILFVPGALALFALWTWRSRYLLEPQSRGAWVWWFLPVAGSAAALLWNVSTSDRIWSDNTEAPMLAVGVIAVLVGMAGWAMLGAAPGRLSGWVLAAAVAVLVTMFQSTFTLFGSWAGGSLTALVNASMLATALWVAFGAVAPHEAARWRTRTWPRYVLSLVALLAVLPTIWTDTVRTYHPSVYDTFAVSSLIRAAVPLLLLATLLGLMAAYGLGSRPGATVSREVAFWMAVVLLLRPDQVSGGIAWSFVAGLALIGWVLLRRREHWTEFSVRPADGQNLPEQAVAVVQRSAGFKLERDMERHMRRKLHSGELNPVDAESIRQVIRTAIEIDAHGPQDRQNEEVRHQSFADRCRVFMGKPFGRGRPQRESWNAGKDLDLNGWNWAGEASPWRRGLQSALLGGVLGVVLLVATLAQALSEVPGILGTDAWMGGLRIVMSFKFPWYGLAFGFLYPLIPGRTGLAKSFRLFVVLASTETLAALIPFNDGLVDRNAVVLRFLQLALLCFALGVGADLRTLRWAGIHTWRLGDLYGRSGILVWSSGLLVATATTLATTMLGSAATVLIENTLLAPLQAPPSPSGPTGGQ
jgi:hypothetical protein